MPSRLPIRSLAVCCLAACAALLCAASATAQTEPAGEAHNYAPLNSVAAFAEYANSSSHIILGNDRQRQFAGLTLAYQRRITANHWMAWDYTAEIRPVLVESDPTLDGKQATVTMNGSTQVFAVRYSHKIPIGNAKFFPDQSISGTTVEGGSFTEVVHNDLGRRWTYSPGIAPLGFSVHLLPEHRLQPFLASTGGFLVSARDIPEFDTSAFNFTLSFGGGVEWFQDQERSWTVEYRVQHLSNAEIGSFNPGVDAQFVRVGYRFGFRALSQVLDKLH